MTVPVAFFVEGPMRHPKLVAVLARQVNSVNGRRIGPDAPDWDVRRSSAVLRSLRRTLACLLQRRDPRELGAGGFLLVTDEAGNPAVRFRSQILPASPAFIVQIWKDAGADLGPGQVLLLDPALGREIAEEALARNSAEEYRLKDEKLKLVSACVDPEAAESAA
jgi:hypothetical protein